MFKRAFAALAALVAGGSKTERIPTIVKREPPSGPTLDDRFKKMFRFKSTRAGRNRYGRGVRSCGPGEAARRRRAMERKGLATVAYGRGTETVENL